jgi:hypothetical protein
MTKEELNKPTRHHRKPRSLGGTNCPENISRIKHKKHLAWHCLFGDMTAQEIAEEINKHYLDPAFIFKVKHSGYQHP